MLLGAVIGGLVLLNSAERSSDLAEEEVRESGATLALFQQLEAARLAGSGYMEEGEPDDLADFNTAAKISSGF